MNRLVAAGSHRLTGQAGSKSSHKEPGAGQIHPHRVLGLELRSRYRKAAQNKERSDKYVGNGRGEEKRKKKKENEI